MVARIKTVAFQGLFAFAIVVRKVLKLCRFIVINLFAIALSSCGPSDPPLLRNVTAQGGYWGACPPVNQIDLDMQKSGHAVSPELQLRLEKEFPPGTDEQKLIQTLREQGFSDVGKPACKTDDTIKSATFRGSSRFLSASVFATIYWKADHENKIVWEKGFVAFDGL